MLWEQPVTVRSQDIHQQVQDVMFHCCVAVIVLLCYSQCRISELLQVHNFRTQLNEPIPYDNMLRMMMMMMMMMITIINICGNLYFFPIVFQVQVLCIYDSCSQKSHKSYCVVPCCCSPLHCKLAVHFFVVVVE